MALFDLSGIVSELNTVISGLDLPNEEVERLAVLIKTAVNLGEDPTSIISELQSRIEAIDDTVLLEKFAVLVGALGIATEDRIVSIATVNDLPDSYTLPSGSIFFVDSIGVEVVAVGNKWLGLDGRLLRDDTPIVDVMSWGFGTSGQLGDGTAISKSSPVTVVGGITNWSAISARGAHSLGLTDTGVLYAWGFGGYGRLGDGTAISKSSPVTVVGSITNWSAIAAGGFHNLGLTDAGVIYAWGTGGNGQLGDGTTIDKSSPVTVVGGITNWSQISAGSTHSLGLTDAGVLYAWGAGSDGRLGDGTIINRSSPVTIIGGITNWSAVSAGQYHSLGLTNTGILYAWGLGTSGRLGDGTAISKSSPVTVVGGITNWSAVNAGNIHSLGLTDAGVLYAWGAGGVGRLGDGTTIARSSPVTVVGGITNWSQISAGSTHSLGLTDAGVLYAWGSGGSGRLGDGTIINKSSPVTVVGGITNWSAIAADSDHNLGLKIRI